MDFFAERLRARPGPPHLPLRAVRADRAQAADGSLRHARGGGRRPAPAGRARRPPAGRAAGHCARRSRATRSRRWSRSTASSARSTCATPASSIVAFEQWLELGEGERPAADAPRADRALQPGRRRQQPAAARLAGAARERAGAELTGLRRSRARRPASAELPPELTEAQARVQALVDRLRRPGDDPGTIRPTERASSRHAGCSPSCSAGIGARRRRCGGSSTA